jgi:hypothetical protein
MDFLSAKKEGRMAIRDIVVSLDPSLAGEGRLKLAVGLARAHKANLTGAYVVPPSQGGPGAVGFGPMPPAGTDGLAGVTGRSAAVVAPPVGAPREAERAEHAEQRFSSEMRLSGIDGEWHLLDAERLVSSGFRLGSASSRPCAIGPWRSATCMWPNSSSRR